MDKNLKNHLIKIESEIKNRSEFQKVGDTLKFLNSFAKDYGLIESEAKLLSSGEEYVLLYKFKSREFLDEFLKNKGNSEIFKIWKKSLKSSKVQKVKFIDNNDNILMTIEKNEMY